MGRKRFAVVDTPFSMSVLKYDMHTMREFSRRLSHFKRLASAGRRVELVDRQASDMYSEPIELGD